MTQRYTLNCSIVRRLPLLLLILISGGLAPSAHSIDPIAGMDKKPKAHRVSVKTVKGWLAEEESVLLVDVRNGGTSDHLPDAIHVPLSRLEWWAETIEDKDQRIVTYCA